jgi:hypothetical protein
LLSTTKSAEIDNLSELVGHVDRKIIRKEFNTEALFIAAFTETQIAALGDLSELSRDRMHQLLESRLGEALIFGAAPTVIAVVRGAAIIAALYQPIGRN